MKEIYNKAMEMLEPKYMTSTISTGKTIKLQYTYANHRIEFKGFEFLFTEEGEGYDRSIKIMKKDIGFKFKIMKKDPEDLNRMQYVYDVTLAAKNNQLLLPFARKVKTSFVKIQKNFPGKISKREYDSLDIHDKNKVITFLNKLI